MPKPRVLVIGLDGATWDLMRPWVEAGDLPHLSRLAAAGSAGPLSSTIPPVSPAAWSSFMTGKNPGQHGVFDFTVRDFRSYGVSVARRPAAATLWGILSAQGKRVCVINVPQTFPPEAVNGIMVTGLGTPSQTQFTYPEVLTARLRREHYPVAGDATFHGAATPFVRQAYRVAEHVTETSLTLLQEVDWDFAMVVLRLTDEIPHFFWHWMDSAHPAYEPADSFHREAVRRSYQKSDELLGRLLAQGVDDETTVLVVSDHGFGPLHKDVYLNEWLRQRGFLKLRTSPTARARVSKVLQELGLTRTRVGHALARWRLNWLRGALRDGLGTHAGIFPNDSQMHVREVVDWANTRAYSVGYIGQIYLNLAGRDPQGTVKPGQEYEDTLAELKAQLLEMVDPADGQRVVDCVWRKEEIYSGPYLARAPDLLVLMRGLTYITRQAYEFGGRGQVFAVPPTHETGGHRLEGALIVSGRGAAQTQWLEGARLIDITPTVLYLLGCAAPADLDGRVLTEFIRPELVASRPIEYAQGDMPHESIESLTPEEEQRLLEHLRNLGYLN